MARNILLFSVALPLALAACGGRQPAETADNQSVNGTDPALASALQDQIMVDPQLTAQANANAVRPPNQPYSGAVPGTMVAANGTPAETAGLMKAPAPVQAAKTCTQCAAARESLTLGGLASRQKNGTINQCAGSITYSASWANRLPRDLPLYPQARVTEAAGSTAGRCALRVVSFASPHGMQQMLDWYYTKAVRAGYDAEHQVDGDEHILGGTRKRDDAAYVLFMTARADGGTDVDLVANNGI